jgi:hypothetical protein
VAARLQSQNTSVFIVGMSRDHHQAAGILQATKGLFEAGTAGVLWQWIKVGRQIGREVRALRHWKSESE